MTQRELIALLTELYYACDDGEWAAKWAAGEYDALLDRVRQAIGVDE